MSLKLFLPLLLLACTCLASSVYIELTEGQKSCFQEDLAKNKLLQVSWKGSFEEINPSGTAPGYVSGEKVGIRVIVTGPQEETVLFRELPLESRVALTAQVDGVHKICLQTNTSKHWFRSAKSVKLELRIDTGIKAVDYAEVANVEHLTDMELKVKRLNDYVAQLRGEQLYQRHREIAFRDTSEVTNSRAMWWSILQLLILVSIGVWQMNHLKNFFKAKKMV